MNIPTLEYILEKAHSRGTQRFLKKEFPEFLVFLNDHYPNDLSISEKLYWYFNHLDKHPICKTCGSEKVSYNGLSKGYKTFCSLKCSRNHPDTIQKLKHTNLKRYGVEYNSQSAESKKKMADTNLKKYGCICSLHNPEIQQKSRKTKLEKYGDETYTNTSKMIETNMVKYGVKCTLQTDDVIQKSRKTKLEKYGDETYTNINKRKETNLEKYGGCSPFHSEKIQSKAHFTKLKNFCKNNTSWLKSCEYDEYNRLIYICKCPHDACNKCQEKEFKILAQQYDVRRYNGIETCTHLLPSQTDKIRGTYIELFIREILDEYNISYQTNVRNVISPKEIDIYIPEKNIAIECNGIYWHSKKDQDYHFKKYNLCKEKGIQLLTIWEDWVVNKPEIIKSIILSKLGIYENIIYARNCSLKNISNREAKKFIEENHLQGYVNSSIKLGLYYNDELVSIMTFGRKRKIMNNSHEDGMYEMYRFCNKLNTKIIGGASKLFKNFIKIYNPKCIESYSSNDISVGSLYSLLNFKPTTNSISMWFIDGYFRRYHRFKYAKKEIPNDVKTIFDSGNTKYVWKCNK